MLHLNRTRPGVFLRTPFPRHLHIDGMIQNQGMASRHDAVPIWAQISQRDAAKQVLLSCNSVKAHGNFKVYTAESGIPMRPVQLPKVLQNSGKAVCLLLGNFYSNGSFLALRCLLLLLMIARLSLKFLVIALCRQHLLIPLLASCSYFGSRTSSSAYTAAVLGCRRLQATQREACAQGIQPTMKSAATLTLKLRNWTIILIILNPKP